MTPVEQVTAAIAEHGSPNWVAYVPMSIVKQVPYTTLVELLINARKVRTDDKHRAILNYALANPDTLICTADVAAIMQVSLPTARNFLKDNPQLFTNRQRGNWYIRETGKK